MGNNHHQAPLLGEDFQMWEKDLPGAQATQHYNQVWGHRRLAGWQARLKARLEAGQKHTVRL